MLSGVNPWVPSSFSMDPHFNASCTLTPPFPEVLPKLPLSCFLFHLLVLMYCLNCPSPASLFTSLSLPTTVPKWPLATRFRHIPHYINFQCSNLCHSEASNRNMPLWSAFRSWFVITMLFAILGVLLSSSSSMLEASSVMFWPFPFPSIAHLLRFLPPPQAFGNLIRELTSIVERWYPGSSPLEEDSARAWTLIASRSIYRCTGDVVSGTLACAVLVSFLISRHETPIYVFLTWAILVVAYLMNNREELAGNDTDSKGV